MLPNREWRTKGNTQKQIGFRKGNWKEKSVPEISILSNAQNDIVLAERMGWQSKAPEEVPGNFPSTLNILKTSSR